MRRFNKKIKTNKKVCNDISRFIVKFDVCMLSIYYYCFLLCFRFVNLCRHIPCPLSFFFFSYSQLFRIFLCYIESEQIVPFLVCACGCACVVFTLRFLSGRELLRKHILIYYYYYYFCFVFGY